MSLLYESLSDFDEASHTYKVEGIEVPSVTTILKEMGFMKNLDFYTPTGASRGTYVHALTEQYDNGDMDWSEVGEYMPFVEAYIQAKEDLQLSPLLREERMFNREFWVAGTLDVVAEIRQESIPYLIDIKSGQEEKWHELQLILYGSMIKYHDGAQEHPLKMGTLYLKKTGKYKFVEKNPVEAFYQGAYGAVKAYHVRRSMV